MLLHPVGRRSSDGARGRRPESVRRALSAQSGTKARGIQYRPQAILRERSDEENEEPAKSCLADANIRVLLNRKRIAVVDTSFCDSAEGDDKTPSRHAMLPLRWVYGQCHSPFTALVVVSQERTAVGSKRQTAVGTSMGATAVGPISSWRLAASHNLKRELFSIGHDAQVLFAILKHPHAPWSAKIISGCAIAYLLSPIQLIPSFIPIIGSVGRLGCAWARNEVCETVGNRRRSRRMQPEGTGLASGTKQSPVAGSAAITEMEICTPTDSNFF